MCIRDRYMGMEHIIHYLPRLRKNIENVLADTKRELKSLGLDFELEAGAGSNYNTVLFIISKYCDYYKSCIEGKNIKKTTSEYKGGSRIQVAFNEIYINTINEFTPFDNLSDTDIRTAIYNAKGLRPSLFIPEAAFESLIKIQIKRLLQPSLACASQIHDELKNVAIHNDVSELKRFDKLNEKISEIMCQMLKDFLLPTEKSIENLIDVELSYINVNHPDMLSGTSTILSMIGNYKEEKNKLPKIEEKKEVKKEVKKEIPKKKRMGYLALFFAHFRKGNFLFFL
eukprot:TRINITY_DN2188_c0_g1_i4.p1 TRINITY_DN2188_c0_g1~~TRINITY_DN2188_c0_g1_i4.p1  ORF type:complete len:284 (-),score=54.78 TRINITY_DN2188_c0_g1_i4:70-921(-)